MTTDPRVQYDVLLRRVMAFRWMVDPEDEKQRAHALKVFLEAELSDAGMEHLRILLAFHEAYYERTMRCVNRTGPDPAWDGWDEECDTTWFPRMGALEPLLTEADKRDRDARGRGFEHVVAMDNVYHDMVRSGQMSPPEPVT